MKNLEQKVENSFFGMVKKGLGRIKHSTISKVAVYSLTGVFSIGLYRCGSGDGMSITDDVSKNVEKPQTKCWEKIFEEGAVANSVQQTIDGGYIAAGHVASDYEGNGGTWVLKLDSNGNITWNKTFVGHGANSVRQTVDGGYVIAGETKSDAVSLYNAAEVFKLDLEGYLEWDKMYGGNGWNHVRSIQQTKDGGYVVVGKTQSGGFEMKAWVFKLDTNGEIEWENRWGKENMDKEANSIQQTSDGGYIAAGSSGGEAWVLKLDSKGNPKWDKTFVEWNTSYSIQQTIDGGYITAGGMGAWVIKLDLTGEIEWNKTFSKENRMAEVSSIQQTIDGGYIVTGSITAGLLDIIENKEEDVLVFKFDSNGSLEWDKTFNKTMHDYAYSIQQTTDLGYIVAGETNDSESNSGMNSWILKLDSNGDLCK